MQFKEKKPLKKTQEQDFKPMNFLGEKSPNDHTIFWRWDICPKFLIFEKQNHQKAIENQFFGDGVATTMFTSYSFQSFLK